MIKMRSAQIQAVILTLVISCLVCLVHVAPAAGSGPDTLEATPIWNLTTSQCSLFRNEAVLRPLFALWPESIKSVPFRYCCEYQPLANALTAPYPASIFNLSTYRYDDREGSGTLLPAPYFDLGLIDRSYAWYWQHWICWKLPTRIATPPLYCEVTDLHRLYMHRFWWKTIVRASETAAALIAVLLVCGIAIPLCRIKRVRWEELWSDMLHAMLLSGVGCSLMEGIGHSELRDWRSQLMFNTGVVYSYLTLFTMLSAVIRHSIRRESERRNRRHATESWRWQKVFGQFAANFIVGAYLILVDDVSGRRLDGLACLVLGTVVGASIYSAGVELFVISQFFTLRPIVDLTKGSPKCDSDSDSNSPVPPV